jgi:CheY-like chemotaxis protein
MDLMMPKMDGFAMLEALKCAEKTTLDRNHLLAHVEAILSE